MLKYEEIIWIIQFNFQVQFVVIFFYVSGKQLTDITEVICTGLGRRGTVCPLGRCLTSGYEAVGELLMRVDTRKKRGRGFFIVFPQTEQKSTSV